jgi:hypothetical protein
VYNNLFKIATKGYPGFVVTLCALDFHTDLVQAFPKKWWVESDFTAPNLPLPLLLKGSGCHYNSIFNKTGTN